MTEPLTLAQRLRDQHHMTQGDGLGATLTTASEAAARIEADEATIASLRDANKALTAERDEAIKTLFIEVRRVDRLSAELAEARKALEPFAWIGQWLFARNMPDDTPMVTVEGVGKPVHLTRGMFKAAHTARFFLNSKEGDPHAE